MQAVAWGRPFAVVPCCVFSREFPHRKWRGPLVVSTPAAAAEVPATHDTEGQKKEQEESKLVRVTSYADFMLYLQAKAPGIQTARLMLEGKNVLLFRRACEDPSP